MLSPGGAGVKTLGGSPPPEMRGLRVPLLGVLGRDSTRFSRDSEGKMAFSLDLEGGIAFSLDLEVGIDGGGITSFAPRTRRWGSAVVVGTREGCSSTNGLNYT